MNILTWVWSWVCTEPSSFSSLFNLPYSKDIHYFMYKNDIIIKSGNGEIKWSLDKNKYIHFGYRIQIFIIIVLLEFTLQNVSRP